VVLPTLNCAHLLPDHLDSMQPWLDLVEQIVVVDSHSDDGTWEMLQKRLAGHPGATFHQRPRGLYQSWNFGISQLETDFTYVSTVGDSITRAGLEHLLGAASELQADVVVSKPDFIKEDGTPSSAGISWPIDKLLTGLSITKPAVMDDWVLLLFLLENPVDAVLGSSASNLYRTSSLQEFPFPTQFGTVGDGAWGLANVFNYRLAVTPERFSTFRLHEKSYSARTYAVEDLNDRLFNLLVSSFENVVATDARLAARARRLNCSQILSVVADRMHWQKELERNRDRWLPWIFNPWVWRIRSKRNQLRTDAQSLRTEALRLLDKHLD
jgi:glycosyltransferase involved in cell wall biosynthesis